jgi:photosystem II stability/assembly factor-like uncharacterized protein
VADQFPDTSAAWVVENHTNGTVTLVHTNTAGRTWQPAGFWPQYASLPKQLDFVTPQQGWLLIGGGGMPANALALFQTRDAGHHWSIVATRLPISGLLGFATATTGWATDQHAGGAPACPRVISAISPGALYVTRDGGRTWRLQRLSIPGRYCTAILNLSTVWFFTPCEGVLPVTFSFMAAPGRTTLVVYVTHDGGRHWQAVAPLLLHAPSSVVLADFIAMQYGWAIIPDSVATRLYATSDGGRHWHPVPSTVSLTDVGALDFVTPRIGFALVGRPTAQGRLTLLKTRDGGQTWIILHSRA